MRTKIFLCALVAVFALSSCKKDDKPIFEPTPLLSFEPTSLTLSADSQWYEVKVVAKDDQSYQVLVYDDAASVLAFDGLSYQMVSGTNTFYVTAKPVKKSTTVTICAMPKGNANGRAVLSITVKP